jgi:hypothetical protein
MDDTRTRTSAYGHERAPMYSSVNWSAHAENLHPNRKIKLRTTSTRCVTVRQPLTSERLTFKGRPIDEICIQANVNQELHEIGETTRVPVLHKERYADSSALCRIVTDVAEQLRQLWCEPVPEGFSLVAGPIFRAP